jgi:hypothetical protein
MTGECVMLRFVFWACEPWKNSSWFIRILACQNTSCKDTIPLPNYGFRLRVCQLVGRPVFWSVFCQNMSCKDTLPYDTVKYFMVQNYQSNGNLRTSWPSENNGLACESRATRSHQTGWQWRLMRICSVRQRMMAHQNKWIKRILTRHTLTTWMTSHCTLHQVLFFFSLSRVFKCDSIFTPKELGAVYADCTENTLH